MGEPPFVSFIWQTAFYLKYIHPSLDPDKDNKKRIDWIILCVEQLPFYNKDQIIHQSFALFIFSSCSSLVEMVQKPATPPPFLKSAFAKMSPEAASTISACVLSSDGFKGAGYSE